jgi:catechol 2,3-dioxygenase-like lactoylglutathione lyase family enzyme
MRRSTYLWDMSTTEAPTVVTGVDFVSIPTQDLERAVEFYGSTLGLPRSMYKPERNFAEFETGAVTLSVVNPEKMGIGDFRPNANHLALHVEDVAAARATLEERGVTFMGDTFDTGVCHMAFFADPDGNLMMLHHRYAPRVPENA